MRDLLILKQASNTNYLVEPAHAARLAKMWTRSGIDWSRAESIAGLWAYKETLGREVSKRPGSPVARIAILTGRAIAGVYNKVMNFRSLDPNDPRAGMTGAGETDRSVWKEYYDESVSALRAEALDLEFARLWADFEEQRANANRDADACEAAFEQEVARRKAATLEELMEAYRRKQEAGAPRRPVRKSADTLLFDRDPDIVRIAKLRARFRCEVNGCTNERFVDSTGELYVEVHHIVPLADGGEDTPENTAALCAGHHREIHLGAKRAVLRDKLLELRGEPALIRPMASSSAP